LNKFYKIICLSVFIILLSACSSIPKEGHPINDFTFIDQSGEKFGLEDLKGKVWVADFVFTNCTTVCPPMSANMSQLQEDVKAKGLKDVHFVSFSVDPDIDTPEVLTTYGKAFGADFSMWHFLTGFTQQEIEDFALESFRSHVKKPRDDDQVMHGIRFYLVNKNGEIIADYPGNEDVPFKEIMKNIKDATKQ
jgi:protein SCO1/2